ncbi:MAG: glycosyltransferase, partial [Lachnospiraceae bacterium]|nr:glycosyltransferase [Candidatus Merdinaster equi]
EGMPNALMEAMAMGMPCISTDCPCGGPAMLIENGVNGLLTSVGDSDEMARAIERVVTDEKFSKSLSINAIKIRESARVDKIYAMWKEYALQIIEEWVK